MAISADSIAADFRLSLRQLTRRRAFTAVALLTLAPGIGAPTAIFSVVRGVLLRPLPYPDADRIVRFSMHSDGPAGPQKVLDLSCGIRMDDANLYVCRN